MGRLVLRPVDQDRIVVDVRVPGDRSDERFEIHSSAGYPDRHQHDRPQQAGIAIRIERLYP